MPSTPTKILHLEDSKLDHKLVVATLSDAGIDFEITRVDTSEAFRAGLGAGCADLIIADYNLPLLDGLGALREAHAACPDLPYIVVTGAMGDIAAVEILKAGATDYVLKANLERLPQAVRRALREKQDRIARRHAEEAVREARDAAEAANTAKDHFLAVLSHELRTPLTPVLTTLQFMEGMPTLPLELREYVEMIRRNVQLEVKLIDDLLDLTRVSRGKLSLNLQTVDAHEAVRQVLDICASDLRGKRLSVLLQLDAAAFHVHADPARFQQILWNLLKNAVKFTGEGGRITVLTRNTSDSRLEIQVGDTGIGIEPHLLQSIFNAFEQGGKQVTQRFGGLGLGLAISHALAEQHAGSLTAFSDGPNRGATFTLSLPASAVAPVTSVGLSGNGDGVFGSSRCSVLLVDDHPDTLRAMGRILKSWGCNVQTADSVAAALKAADAGAFDVLISDIGLPDGSGYDLIQQLLASRPIRGICLSGFGMEEDLLQSQKAGFKEHLVKPIDILQLQAAIRRVLVKE